MLLDLKDWVRDEDLEINEPPRFGDMIITTGCRISEVVGHLTDPPEDAWWGWFSKGTDKLYMIRKREEDENLRVTLNTDTMLKLKAFRGDPAQIVNYLYECEGLRYTEGDAFGERDDDGEETEIFDDTNSEPQPKRMRYERGVCSPAKDNEDYDAKYDKALTAKKRAKVLASFMEFKTQVEEWKKDLKAEREGTSSARRPNPYEVLKSENIVLKCKNREIKYLLNAAKTNLETKCRELAHAAADSSQASPP